MDNRINKRVNGFFLCLVLLHLSVSVILSVLGTGAVNLGTFGALMFTQLLIMVPSFVFLLVFKCDLSQWVPFKKLRPGTIALTVLFTFLTMPLISLINVFSQLFTTNTAIEMSGDFMDMPVVMTVFMVGFFGPFCEEFTFRGIIFGGLRKHGFVFAAAVVSGLYFGLMHLNLNQFSYALVLGVIFALLVEATGSIWGSVIAHAVINTWNVLLMILMDKAGSEMGVDIFEMTDELGSTDMKLEMIGIMLVISVVTSALAVGVYIGISRHEGRYDKVVSMFCRPQPDRISDEDVWPEEDAMPVTDPVFEAPEQDEMEQESTERTEDGNRRSVGKLVTVSGYIAIAVCLFVIFALDKVVAWISANYQR